jgi:hypothetical protein
LLNITEEFFSFFPDPLRPMVPWARLGCRNPLPEK